ncbi:MAG TPA: membrane protein insertase YidC [Vicinamibacterales bacterium]|jgi:YidC/Oxa1 family membrane protein insertase|nr:membrane protein insertase YidC [Vicinamibacterales bacterium]
MERRVLFAVFLCFLVLYLWQALVVKPVPAPTQGVAPKTAPAAVAPPATTEAESSPPETQEPPSPSATALVAESTERDIRVETDDVIAVFTNRGARLKSWRLKKYLDGAKQPQELVEKEALALKQPLPFTLKTADPQMNLTLTDALYAVSGQPPGDGVVSSRTDLRFEFRDSAGVHAVKEFQIEPSSYIVTVRATVSSGDQVLPAALVWGPAVGDRLKASTLVQGAQGIYFEAGGEDPVRLTASAIAKQPMAEGNFRYAGVDDNYFMTAALDTGQSRITFQPVTIPAAPNTSEAARELVSFTLERQASGDALKVFVGPKALDVLTAIDREFANAIHFGRFAIIVVPLLQSLKWLHGFVGNWGWAIVILTIIINVVMAPLRHKQVVSMRKMQEIQPEMKAIQDRYSKLKATDPAKQKMNQELMALYRERGANPAAGCVPMLLIIPIMIAMWAALQVSIELRGAPWVGWISDLSAPDPYYVLPVLMVATQFWQQKMAPMTGADPAQQKMMLFMPLVMGFIFFSLPSGALLYYVAGTLIGIGQQYLTNYLIGPPNVRTVRPPAERRVKRVGGGKTEAASREK